MSLIRHFAFARSILSIVTPMTKIMTEAMSSKIPVVAHPSHRRTNTKKK